MSGILLEEAASSGLPLKGHILAARMQEEVAQLKAGWTSTDDAWADFEIPS